MGRQYGEELRDDVRDALEAVLDLAADAGHRDEQLAERIAAYVPFARRLPERCEELTGVAEGAGIGFRDVLLMQMLEDLLDVDACTTAARAGTLLHAEMWFASQTKSAVFVAEPPEGPPVITVSCAGFLTGVGLNGSGFAVGVQSTASLDARVGVPRALVSRNVLCAPSADNAVREATGHQRSGGNGFVIATGSGVRTVETSATRQFVSDEMPWGAHTNHYTSAALSAVAKRAGESAGRLDEAAQAIREATDEGVATDAKAMVQSSGFVPRSPDGSVVTAFVMVANVQGGSVEVAPGDGRQGPWTVVALP